MQIRIQGNKVQLIRTKYDPETKKNRAEKTLSFDKGTYPGEDILTVLTEPQRQQLQAWLLDEGERLKKAQDGLYASLGAGYIRDIADAASSMTAQQASAVWLSIDVLRVALRKAGHRRPAAKTVVKKAATKTAKLVAKAKKPNR